MYFETRTKSTRKEDGKAVSEQHIMKAVCFTDAEVLTIENFGENETFEVTHIAKSKITEIINPDAELFYKVTIEFVSVDEGAGKEKKIKEQLLFGASSYDDVKVRIDEWLAGSSIPTDVYSLVESKIKNVL